MPCFAAGTEGAFPVAGLPVSAAAALSLGPGRASSDSHPFKSPLCWSQTGFVFDSGHADRWQMLRAGIAAAVFFDNCPKQMQEQTTPLGQQETRAGFYNRIWSLFN